MIETLYIIGAVIGFATIGIIAPLVKRYFNSIEKRFDQGSQDMRDLRSDISNMNVKMAEFGSDIKFIGRIACNGKFKTYEDNKK